MSIIFNSISIYFWIKISLPTIIRNKRVISKINLYFLTLRKMTIFYRQIFVIFNMIKDSFSVEKWGTLERTLGTSKNKKSFWKSFSFPFSAKCFDGNFECFLSCTLPFCSVVKFEDLNHCFHYFLSKEIAGEGYVSWKPVCRLT